MVLQKVAVQVSMHLLIKVCNALVLMYKQTNKTKQTTKKNSVVLRKHYLVLSLVVEDTAGIGLWSDFESV